MTLTLPSNRKVSYFQYFLLLLTFMLTNQICFAQMDTLIANNQKIACSIKEITPEAVRYTFPNEEVINTVYKNTVQKIIYKSGRIQTFAEATSYKTIDGVKDYNNVTITTIEGEVKGLFKLSDVSSKAKGTTVYSSQERVKDRAYRKLKIQAAMFGGNTILLTNQRTEGNKYGGYFSSSSTAETNLTGIAYSNVLPDFEQFKKLIGKTTTFIAVQRFELGASDSDVSEDSVNKVFVINDVKSEGGIIIITGNLKGESDNDTFQVSGFNEKSFSIAYRRKGTAYNYKINI